MDAIRFKDRMETQLSGSVDDFMGVGDEEKFIRREVDAALERVITRVAFAKKNGCNTIHVMPLYAGDYAGQNPRVDGLNLSPIAAGVAKVIIDASFCLEYQPAGGPNFHMFLRFTPSTCL